MFRGFVFSPSNVLSTQVHSPVGHTLYDPRDVLRLNKGKTPLTYTSFLSLAAKLGPPPAPVGDGPASLPPALPPPACEGLLPFPHGVPTLEGLGYPPIEASACVPFPGGETEALRRMEAVCARPEWVASFDKPSTDPTMLVKPLSTPKAKPSNPFEAAAAPSSGKGKKAVAPPQPAGGGAASDAALPLSELWFPSTTGLSPYLKARLFEIAVSLR